MLIGNRKFCRHVVASAPNTAIAFFQTMTDLKKYDLPIGQFAANVSAEAIRNKDSSLYHEDEGYYSGLLGYIKPVSKALYGDFDLVEGLASSHNSPLDIGYKQRSWDATQLEAYCRAVLLTLESYLTKGRWGHHSYALVRALDIVKDGAGDLYKINGTEETGSDSAQRLRVAVGFVQEAIGMLQKHMPLRTTLRHRRENRARDHDLFDEIADTAFELILAASHVRKVRFGSETDLTRSFGKVGPASFADTTQGLA